MKNIIALLFPHITASFVKISPAKRTVDSALVHFNKALTELRAVKAAQDAEVELQNRRIMEAQEAADIAEIEAVRAARAIAKIEDFIV